MLEPRIEFFYKDDIERIIQECLIYPYCKIMIAVKGCKIKDVALNFSEHINPNTLARRFRISTCYARADFTNGAELLIIENNAQSRGHKVSKIYCSPDTSIEAYFYVFKPQLFDYKCVLERIEKCGH